MKRNQNQKQKQKRKRKRKFKSLFITSAIFLFIFGAALVLKNIFLQQVKRQIQSSFGYTQLYLNFFPPSLIIEDARSLSSSPFFSAKKISFRMSFQALLSREKPFRVFIENPIFRFYEISEGRESLEQLPFQFNQPFSLEMGWIKDGELYYWGKEDRLQAKRINARLSQRRDLYSLLVESGETVYYSSLNPNPIKGTLSLALEGEGENVEIKKLRINSPTLIFRAQGSLTNPLNPDFNLSSSFNIKSDLIARLLKLPFEWEGVADGKGNIVRKGGNLQFDADFSSRTLYLNGVDMGKVDGRVNFDSTDGGLVDVNVQRRGLEAEQLKIRFKDKKIQGTAFGVYIDPVMKFLLLPWPVPSQTWGNFTVEKKTLTVDAEFRDDFQDVKPSEYPLQGQMHVDWDGQKDVAFSSENLVTQFAEVKVQGDIQINQSLDIVLNGNISDVKQAREFTSELLDMELKFPEIRGSGEANIYISGDIASPDVRGDFSLSPAGFAQFDSQAVTGSAEFIGNEFYGNFAFDDPFALGHVQVSAKDNKLEANIFIERGAVEHILPTLNVTFPIQGYAAGEFKLLGEDKNINIQGSFSSPSIDFIGQPLTQLQGRLAWEDNTLSFSNLQCQFHGGRIEGSTLLAFSRREFELDISTENINLTSIFPSIKGFLSLDLKGGGVFGQDYSSGKFALKSLLLKPLKETEVQGDVRLGFTEEHIHVSLDGNFLPGDNDVHLSLDIPFASEIITGDVRGSFSNFDLIIPWEEEALGRINYLGELKSFHRSFEVKGAIDFQGSVFPFPKFAHALRDYSGLIFVENETLTLRSLQGKIGGGDVQGQGIIGLGKNGIETIDLKLDGENLLLSPLERTQALAGGSLNLIKDADRFVLNGDFDIQRLSWQREFDERFVFYSTPFQVERKEGFFDDLNLNIRLHADDNAWMENTLGRIKGRFDLTVSGNTKLPIVIGDIDALEGQVFFQDRSFDIVRGRVSFSNPVTIEPYLSFTGETFVKDFRVTFSLDGLLDKLIPEFSSSPPLPPEDVLALLALGESFQRTYHYDRSTRQSTASLVSFQLSEEAKKSADKLFRLDRFRIDPFVLGSSTEMTARLTLGKRISRNFFVLYSTNLTTQREEIVRIEWELTRDLSIVATRDEKGRISFDIKIHKRF
ncbi:translocation/assembly module TamB domain-containing protein [Acidobacteriota bacterium]